MRNKFKRIKLNIRNYKVRKIIFSLVFVLTLSSLSILIPKLSIHADPVDPEIILNANANVIQPIGGESPSWWATSSDDTRYSVILASWNLEEGPDYPYLENTDYFETGKDYTARVIFTANEGYTFDENTVFTINNENSSSYGSTGFRQTTFQNTPAPNDNPEPKFSITYDLNGGTSGGESTIVEQSGSVGFELSEENLLTELGVMAPAGKVLNYVTINDQPFNIGDSFFLDRNIIIKYFWRDDTENMCTIAFDPNGGNATEDYVVPDSVPCGQAFVLNAPDESQVAPPENQELDAFEVNDDRYENGSLYIVDRNSFFRLLWRNAEQGENPEQNFEAITFNIHWSNSFVNTWVNDISIMDESQDFVSTEFVYEDLVVNNAGYTDPTKTNTIRLQTRFGDLEVTEFTINGVVYDEESQNVEITDEGWFITVPGASVYNISGTGDPSSVVPRTIIWANVDADHNAEGFDDDMLLEHGRAKVIAIYDGETLVSGETDVDPETGMGWVQVTPGNQVIFEFVPEYGYQLTGVEANGQLLEPQETINQYNFTMPDTNIHFAATFESTADIVEVDSEKVTSGSITLNGGLEGGSAQLTVKDIELDADKIAGFENAAGDYTISSYLDIDLYNIFQKANSDNNDVWSNKIDELDKYAIITIQLAEGIDANNIVIVHNVHDGEEYEIIEIDSYDPDTNTITFHTKSFSNYAIATLKSTSDSDSDSESEPESKTDNSTVGSPDTGIMTEDGGSATIVTIGAFIIPVILVGFAIKRIKH